MSPLCRFSQYPTGPLLVFSVVRVPRNIDFSGLIQAQAGWAGNFVLSLEDSGAVALLGSCAVLWWKVPAMGLGSLGALDGS